MRLSQRLLVQCSRASNLWDDLVSNTQNNTCRTNMDGVVHGNLSRFRKFLLFSSIHTERSILANPSKPHISVKLCALCPACMTGPSYLLSFSNASIHHLGNVADGWSSQRCTEYKGRQLCSPAFVTSASSEGWGESHSQWKLGLVP